MTQQVGDDRYSLAQTCTNSLRRVAPSEPVKFLVTRVTIKLGMTPERSYIIQKVKERSKVLNNHPYHPSQVNWITQIAVLAIVKLSAALAQWDEASIRQLDTVIRQTQRKAWKLPPGCLDLAFWAGEDHDGQKLTYYCTN